MDRTKNHGHRSWNNRDRGAAHNRQDRESVSENAEAIKAFKMQERVCPLCNKPLTDISTALAHKETGEPVHFDCVLEMLQAQEKLMPGQKVTYIGQGRFAVVYFPNVHDTRNFTIERIIEWEKRDAKFPWRDEMAGLYSQVK